MNNYKRYLNKSNSITSNINFFQGYLKHPQAQMKHDAEEKGNTFQLAKSDPYKSYASYKSPDAFLRDHLRINECKPQYFYELIPPDCKVKPYLDIEEKEQNGGAFSEETFKAKTDALIEMYLRVWNETFPDHRVSHDVFRIANASLLVPKGGKKAKLSMHITIASGHAFANNTVQQKAFVGRLVRRIKAPKDDQETRWSKLLMITADETMVDEGVYTKNRLLRMIGSVKYEDKHLPERVLTPMSEHPLQDFVVACLPSDATILPTIQAANISGKKRKRNEEAPKSSNGASQEPATSPPNRPNATNGPNAWEPIINYISRLMQSKQKNVEAYPLTIQNVDGGIQLVYKRNHNGQHCLIGSHANIDGENEAPESHHCQATLKKDGRIMFGCYGKNCQGSRVQLGELPILLRHHGEKLLGEDGEDDVPFPTDEARKHSRMPLIHSGPSNSSIFHTKFNRTFQPGAFVPPIKRTDDTNDIAGMTVFRPSYISQHTKKYIPFPDAHFNNYIAECALDDLQRGEIGDANFMFTFFGGPTPRLLYDQDERQWYSWGNHHWERDVSSLHQDLIHRYATKKHQHFVHALENCHILREINILRNTASQLEEDIIKASASEQKTLRDKLNDINKRLAKLLPQAKPVMKIIREAKHGRIKCLTTVRTLKNVAIQMERLFSKNRYKDSDGSEVVWDTHPTQIACPNGVLDLQTGTLRNGHPLDFCRSCIPTEFKGIDEPMPQMTEVLNLVCLQDKAKITFLQKWFGVAMSGISPEQALLLYGDGGRNFKGVMCKLIMGVLASKSNRNMANEIKGHVVLGKTGQRAAAKNSHDSHVMKLKGLHSAFIDEVAEDHHFDVQDFKRLTGRVEVPARGCYSKEEETLSPTWSITLKMNHQPRVKDPSDDAFWQRVFMIEFFHRFIIDPDPNNKFEHAVDDRLYDKLLKERSGILAWMVRGFMAYEKDGHNFGESKSMKEAKNQYRISIDPVRKWFNDCPQDEESAKRKWPATHFFTAFKIWARKNNVWKKESSIYGMNTFIKHFKKIAGIQCKKSGDMKYWGMAIDKMPDHDDWCCAPSKFSMESSLESYCQCAHCKAHLDDFKAKVCGRQYYNYC